MLIPDRKPAEKPKKKPVKPVFYTHMPKNAVMFFSRDADWKFFREHPKLYLLLALLGIVVLFGPAALYTNFVVFPRYYSNWMLLGLAGGLVIGMGFLNIVSAWLEQYLGHIFTTVCILLGSGMIIVSLLLI